MNSKIAVLSTLALMLGCATGAVVSRLAVPEVRAGTNPTRWEYVCGQTTDAAVLETWANKLGSQGWELGGAAGGMMGSSGQIGSSSKARYVWCFKRPLSAGPPGAPAAQLGGTR